MDEAGDLNVRARLLTVGGTSSPSSPVVKEFIVAHLEKYSVGGGLTCQAFYFYRVLFLALVVHRNRIWVFSVSRWESVCLFIKGAFKTIT